MTIRRSVATAITAAVLGIAGMSALAQPASAAPAVTATTTASASQHWGQQRLPAVAVNWAAAWNSGDPQRLADLFVVKGARYTDHAFGDRDYLGRDGVAEWANRTKYVIAGAHLTVTNAFAFGDLAVISWTFNGQVIGAPKPFSVPAVTVLRLRGHQIVTNDDYYSKAEVTRQSGLPAGALG